ncbi:tRNA 2-thiouridine(34) synthase MnmA [Patescibacteria group bacterium]|nr:tRNA 2-thiouridine(34) synthase MnmA [Patescibacteria group bacterium]MBU1123243.1 tRNA 2-thiouridine(34) synthase MnmA [Patescibacteria group bacterium]MBU1911618.1 tRNA 2-thiouridine(34) synthase MnmA [Patescibacteria group bacterium]
MKILIAMSGGIDSSVIAYLLKEQGHKLVGVRFLLWNDPLAPAEAQILSNKCCDAQSAARAKHISEELDFPLHTIDLSEKFKREVVDYYLEGCKKGITPNPCVVCNKVVRFEALLDLLEDFDCEKLATGHFARIEERPDYFALLQGVDEEKDQSYFLYRLTQEHLSKLIFPLGETKKSEVYELAKKFNIPLNAERYRESQNLCFFPEKEPTEFLKRYLDDSMKEGEIVKRDGTKVGTHKGLPLYTIGQRRIGVGGLASPLEVVEKDIEGNRLIVDDQNTEFVNKVCVRDLSFINAVPDDNKPITCECMTRSLSKKKAGRFLFNGGKGDKGVKREKGEFIFSEPQSPQAEGQSLVLYEGNEVIGGGIIV